MGDASSTNGIDNNADDKNTYAKAGFSIYKFASADAGNTSSIGKKVSNNTNNTDVTRLGRVSRLNEGGLDSANKSGVNRANKGRVDKANIERDKKTGARAVVSTDNSTDDGDKLTDQYAGLTSLLFPALTIANCAGNSNLAISKKTSSGAAISTFDEFFAIFSALANTTLKKKPNVCKSNLFLFATYHQY